MDLKKLYYYIICLITFFVLMWGFVDVVSATLSLTVFKGGSVAFESAAPPEQAGAVAQDKSRMAEPLIEDYYQKRMLYDRIGDSLARILLAGGVFAYARFKVFTLEKA
ncbi:MAG: hypothetical protein NT030_02140 [Candidatus Saganbacteria bacterium]|nr:hypothetical protein [Candidatus Saganbacteria bacterium]